MPPANNDPQFVAFATDVLKKAFPAEMVTADFEPHLGCEEFALFQQEIPGIFMFIGNDRPGCDVIPIHSPNYTFNDEIIPVGVKAMCEIALSYTNTPYA